MIILSWKPYNYVQTIECYYIEIITWNHVIISIRKEYLKPYNCANYLY